MWPGWNNRQNNNQTQAKACGYKGENDDNDNCHGEGGEPMKKKRKKSVIASRKTCKSSGTGLSHYVLLEKKAK